MSTVLLGALTAKREDADAQTSTKTEAPAVKPYVDALAGLVPAEVLALSAVILQFCTETSEDETTTVITEPDTLKWAFVALLVLSVVVFVSARVLAKDRSNKAPSLGILVLQCFIPPLAFLGWTMLQPVSAFDVINADLELGIDLVARQTIAVIGAVFLGISAGALGYRLNAATPVAK